jgi:hypothetical protein
MLPPRWRHFFVLGRSFNKSVKIKCTNVVSSFVILAEGLGNLITSNQILLHEGALISYNILI